MYHEVSCILTYLIISEITCYYKWEDECPHTHTFMMMAVSVLLSAWVAMVPAGLVVPRPPSTASDTRDESCSSLQQLLASLQTAVSATEDLCHAAESTGG